MFSSEVTIMSLPFNLPSVLTVTNPQALLAKIGLYALGVILILLVGAAGGYKLGVIIQEGRNSEVVKELNGRIVILTEKLLEEERKDVKTGKTGQNTLTNEIADSGDKQLNSREIREKIVTKYVEVKVPVPSDGGTVCKVNISKAVNSLLEVSNATGFYDASSAGSSDGLLDHSNNPGHSESSAGDEVSEHPEVPATSVSSASEDGGAALLGGGVDSSSQPMGNRA
jgi:vacuolar-type H+-ATPase subunit F/Vma7